MFAAVGTRTSFLVRSSLAAPRSLRRVPRCKAATVCSSASSSKSSSSSSSGGGGGKKALYSLNFKDLDCECCPPGFLFKLPNTRSLSTRSSSSGSSGPRVLASVVPSSVGMYKLNPVHDP